VQKLKESGSQGERYAEIQYVCGVVFQISTDKKYGSLLPAGKNPDFPISLLD